MHRARCRRVTRFFFLSFFSLDFALFPICANAKRFGEEGGGAKGKKKKTGKGDGGDAHATGSKYQLRVAALQLEAMTALPPPPPSGWPWRQPLR